MKIYIAGPMTGLPEYNHAAFSDAAAKLRYRGHEVINPHELNSHELGYPWEFYMKRDIQKLVECDAIYLLNGWMESRGATLERHIAMALGIDIYYEGAGASVLLA